MKRAWRAIERTKPVWWVALFLVLGGPTPGSVGSCSDDVSVSDPEQFCLDSQALYCLRDHEAERIDDDAYDDCLAAVTDMCEGFVWNPAVCNPAPNTDRTRACIAALRSKERLSTPNESIIECTPDVLCGGN